MSRSSVVPVRYPGPVPSARNRRRATLGFNHLNGAFGVVDRRFDLAAVADDAGVQQRRSTSFSVYLATRLKSKPLNALGNSLASQGSSASSVRIGILRGRSSRKGAGRRQRGPLRIVIREELIDRTHQAHRGLPSGPGTVLHIGTPRTRDKYCLILIPTAAGIQRSGVKLIKFGQTGKCVMHQASSVGA